jgi:signal transduction histidine kinase
MKSIRDRLLILLLGLWMTVWLAVALITLERSGHEVTELLDAQLAQTGRVLRQITLAGNLPDLASQPQPLSPVGHPYESKISFQLWREGKLISSFGAAPTGPLAQTSGFSDQEIADTRWRVFGLPTGNADDMLFVAQSYSIRQELVHFLTVHSLEPILWSLPVAILLIWFAVGDGLRPLRRLAEAIQRRTADRLSPINNDSVPVEIRSLTHALNGLLEQLEEALAAERRFAADASHELRTPLTVIKTHAQIAQRSRDPEERAAAIDQLVKGVDRATHLVSQLLTLARLASDAAAIDGAACSLCETVRQVLEDEGASARARSIRIAQSVPDGDPCVVAIPSAVLTILVRNLVDNAVKYTPDGGWVQVTVEAAGAQVMLRVADSGPGIPKGERERIFQRFYRSSDRSVPGAGLGLSIVIRICKLYGARIQLFDGVGGQGLTVGVIFPAPVPSDA